LGFSPGNSEAGKEANWIQTIPGRLERHINLPLAVSGHFSMLAPAEWVGVSLRLFRGKKS
jgi:hypothetical protein